MLARDRATRPDAMAETGVAATSSAGRVMAALVKARLRDYLWLTKPRVMTLLLFTGACAFVAAAGGRPSARLFGESMLGLSLACGGASALNHALEADIDRLMGPRTRHRPVAATGVSVAEAALFGLFLTTLSVALLATT